jgi:hypothetical protein
MQPSRSSQPDDALKIEYWHSLSAEETLSHLAVEPEGLSHEEASARLKQYGFNRLEDLKQMTGAGATRIGASASVKIIEATAA